MGQSLTPSVLATAMSQSHGRSIDLPCGRSCTPTVYLGGADIAASAELIRRTGWKASRLESLDALAQDLKSPVPSCLVFGVSRCGREDLALHQSLAALRPEMPVICTAEDIDLAVVVNIMKAGAFDVLRKPVAGDLLLDTIGRALQRSEVALKEGAEARQLQDRYESLTNRERQVMALVVSGRLNKQVGGDLGISEITVKAHRGRLMRKMQACSFASLVKMSATLKL